MKLPKEQAREAGAMVLEIAKDHFAKFDYEANLKSILDSFAALLAVRLEQELSP